MRPRHEPHHMLESVLPISRSKQLRTYMISKSYTDSLHGADRKRYKRQRVRSLHRPQIILITQHRQPKSPSNSDSLLVPESKWRHPLLPLCLRCSPSPPPLQLLLVPVRATAASIPTTTLTALPIVAQSIPRPRILIGVPASLILPVRYTLSVCTPCLSTSLRLLDLLGTAEHTTPFN